MEVSDWISRFSLFRSLKAVLQRTRIHSRVRVLCGFASAGYGCTSNGRTMQRTSRTVLVLLSLSLPIVGPAHAATLRFTFVNPGSEIAVKCGFNLCDDVYGIEGDLGLNVDFTANTASFVDVEAIFVGPGIFTGRRLDTVLTPTLQGTVVDDSTISFGRGRLPPAEVFLVQLTDGHLKLTGGYDDRFRDGEAVTIDALAARAANFLFNHQDLDDLSIALAADNYVRKLDVNSDTILDEVDLDLMLGILGSLRGDADVNGTVNFEDFLILADNFGDPHPWSKGDFNTNGLVDFTDFLLLANNFGQVAGATYVVPEPTGLALLGTAGLLLGLARLRCRRQVEIERQLS